MKHNLFTYYADGNTQLTLARDLIVFGADIFNRARIINKINDLQRIHDGMSTGSICGVDSRITDFIFEYLVDCVRILIFFENYMKAELILQDYCVHQINKGIPEFKDLADEQKKRPIKLAEIQSVEPFQIDMANQTAFHRAIQENTIGMTVLMGYQSKSSYYKFDQDTLVFIGELNQKRNYLHFNHFLEFSLSQDLIDKLKKLNDFVDSIFANGQLFQLK